MGLEISRDDALVFTEIRRSRDALILSMMLEGVLVYKGYSHEIALLFFNILGRFHSKFSFMVDETGHV